jgi:hypothetical protein
MIDMSYAIWADKVDDWVRDGSERIVKYKSIAAAKRDLKENFVSQNYTIKKTRKTS